MRKSVLDSYCDNRLYRLNSLKIKIKESCNLRCQMCDHGLRTKKVEEISTERVLRVVNEAASLGCRQLSITGGEPTLNKDLEEIYARAKKYNMRTSLLTNGFRVPVSRLLSLVSSGLSKISVSIDHPEPETHDFIRGVRGAFKKSTEFLRECSALRQTASDLYEVSLTTCVLKPNLDAFPSLIKLAKDLGVDVFSVIAVDPHNDGGKSLVPTKNEERVFQKHSLPEIKKMCRQLGIKFRSSGISEDYGLSIDTELSDLPCYFTWANATMAANGDVYPCCDLINISEACLGNVKKTSLCDIFNSTQAAKVRFLAGQRKLPICSRCYWEHDFNRRIHHMYLNRQKSSLVEGEKQYEIA